ncbi:Hsp70 family protein [Sporichthya polymorpha]|uniref:Hsp70 family protein n=1 Tax=Sporichthya polymorpha TaxID=35751 RepID=UPI000375FDBE|nr:Hsp70 family protein [Sporichthya polymorpha]
MTYRLGIDLGTTFTAAAVLRAGGRPEPLVLGSRSAAVPSVVFLAPDGKVLFGEAAEDRAPEAPERVARHFKRRIGDEVPLVLGATAADRVECYAHDLAAAILAWVVAVATAREGERPAEIAVTHPASWTRRKLDLLLGALAAQQLPPVTLITEPEAVAVGYAGTGLISHPATLAVYDLGGGTLDVAILTTSADGRFTRVGAAAGLDGLGGIDFDDAVLKRVLDAVDAASWAGLDGSDVTPEVLRALAKLRAASVAAKETLSSEPTASVSVLLDGETVTVPLERETFDGLIADKIGQSVAFFVDAIASAGYGVEDLSAVLLTGGSVQIPLVTEMLAEDLPEGITILRALDPKAMVAAGAVLSLAAPMAVTAPAPRRGADLAVAHARAFFDSQAASATIPAARTGGSAPVATAAAAVPAAAAVAAGGPPATPPLIPAAPPSLDDAPAPQKVPTPRTPETLPDETVPIVPAPRRRLLTWPRAAAVVVAAGVLAGGAYYLTDDATTPPPAVTTPTSVTTDTPAAADDKPAKAAKPKKKPKATTVSNTTP